MGLILGSTELTNLWILDTFFFGQSFELLPTRILEDATSSQKTLSKKLFANLIHPN